MRALFYALAIFVMVGSLLLAAKSTTLSVALLVGIGTALLILVGLIYRAVEWWVTFRPNEWTDE